MRIVQVSSRDVLGGAEGSALGLHRSYLAEGHDSRLIVGHRSLSDETILQLERLGAGASLWQRGLSSLALRLQSQPRLAKLSRLLQIAALPQAWIDRFLGKEDFNYPGTLDVLQRIGTRPDIIHCHNLHGAYFDLRVLPDWSRKAPILLDLRDMWLLTGHCAHSFACRRFEAGCGRCPDLSIPPSIRRDATAYNWRRKRSILAASSVYLSMPSHWMMQQVLSSGLPHVQARVIPNAIDLSVFKPGERDSARRTLGIQPEASVVVFTSRKARSNPFKDYRLMEGAIQRLSEREVVFLCLGDSGPSKRIGRATIQFLPFTPDPTRVATVLQAADVYIHAARAETFGKSITEALAVGVPVVATRLGGIPEQVVDLSLNSPEMATGILAAPGDAAAFAQAVETLLDRGDLARQLGSNGHNDVGLRFGMARQVNDYLDYYRSIHQDWRSQQN